MNLITLQPETVGKYKIKDCHDLYLKFDVSLLSDVFENFRSKY